MINKNDSKVQLICASDLESNSVYIYETVKQIKQYIFQSDFYSSYVKYNYNYLHGTKKDNSDLITNDWQFCILICKFISTQEPLSNIVFILERFLYDHRYQTKFDRDQNYLKLTINKVIGFCIRSSIIGSLRCYEHNNYVLGKESETKVKSIQNYFENINWINCAITKKFNLITYDAKFLIYNYTNLVILLLMVIA